MERHSPKITHFSWGNIETDTGERFKDAILFPGGARTWDWRESGTDHDLGIQPKAVEELLHYGAEVIVLSTGINQALKVDPKTVQMLEEQRVTYHILQTEQAVQIYNQLRIEEQVGGLFHSTC